MEREKAVFVAVVVTGLEKGAWLMSKWEDIVERKIQEALRDGAFDNLPGKGQPLNLEENPFEDPSMRTAHRMLRNNGFTLPWIEERKEIDADADAARAALARGWARHAEAQARRRPSLTAQEEESWQKELSAFRRRIVDLNRRIANYNLKAPSASFQRLPLDAEREIRNVTQGKNF